jgi:ABC-2 type transport system permease protein
MKHLRFRAVFSRPYLEIRAIFLVRNHEFFHDSAAFGWNLAFPFLVIIGFCMVLVGVGLSALGLVLAARGTSEEFTSGVLNFISWPMMFLSEVWFSLEGSPQAVKYFAQIFPLTHMIKAIRKVMNEGAVLADVQFECLFMIIFAAAALWLRAFMFSWNE